MLIGRIGEDSRLAALIRRLVNQGGVVSASGLWGSSAPLAAAQIAKRSGRTLLYVTAHLEHADEAREDLEYFLGGPCEMFAAWEAAPGEGPASGEIGAERVRLCAAIRSEAGLAAPLIAPIQALMQPVPTPDALEANTLRLGRGEQADSETVVRWLADHGFERLDLVESPGDFARRGDIIDIFPPGETHPVRIEYFDEAIESIRRFDVSTQRSIDRRESVAVCAGSSRNELVSGEVTCFTDYLPADTIVFVDGPAEVQDLGEALYRRIDAPESLYKPTDVLARFAPFAQVHAWSVGGPAEAGRQSFRFNVRSLSRFEGKASEAVTDLLDLAATRDVIVVCDNDGERKRLGQLIAETAPSSPASLQITIGHVSRGFEWVEARTAIVGHHEIFHRIQQRRRVRRTEAVRPLESWLDLQPGDIVVHATHGIARFRSMKPMPKGETGKYEEFLKLEFADKAVLHVPVSQIDLVQKYVGAGHARPQLSKLGGQRWSKTKEKVGEAVAELAESLLRIQAAREANPGTAYPGDTEWQREFEESFPYQETEDQIIVGEELKNDLRRQRPMDRLLCGDVGYGKTELAVRAAFKVIEYGRQAAVLVPTTVLAEQHYRTFSERLADYPFEVRCLSRFRTGGEQKRIIEDVKKGRVDVVIGTHRLLSKDVAFADLGLVVIDEEQRFGVEHKERLKQLRDTVDVLTMTATPIPRTLHMAMLGIRDISSLATPPVDRRSIATQVCHFNDQLIRDAIIREMNRDGQVFIVHNYVRSIDAIADRVRRVVPECRVLVGHGQMPDGALEKVMHRFVNREADVLVATTIIESGIDIPSANTILINRADRYGLADLHQLRGRVGRSNHRAYCYLLLPGDRPVTPKAARRLKSIEEFSELGAGFQIAMRDLEIRGAGNILGPQQSGHIAAVGYDMYCQLLEGAVRRLRNEPEPLTAPVHLELGVEAYIPRQYIPSERARIDIYRRTVACRTPEELEQLEKDLVDAFGQFPPPVSRLLELAEIRVRARRWQIRSILAQEPDIVFSVCDLAKVQALFADAPGSVRMPDPRTIHLRLRPAYFEPPTLLAFLRRMLAKDVAVVGGAAVGTSE